MKYNMKILMVCLGNICRSPLAEGILKDKIKAKGLDWEVDSAGTSGWHEGERPDPRSIKVGLLHNTDIRNQRSRKLLPEDLQKFDLIFAMDSSNYQKIIALANSEEERNKVNLIMNMVNPDMNEKVPDPYLNDDGFENVYNMLDRACDAIVEKYAQVEQKKMS